MAIATTGKDVLAKFFDEGAYSALYADGAVTAAFGSANGTPVYAVCQTGAAVAEKDTEKVVKVLDMAAKTGNPVVTFYNSVGAKLEEGLAALSGSAAVAAAVAKVSGVVPQIAVVTGVCGAGSALAAAAAHGIPQARIDAAGLVVSLLGLQQLVALCIHRFHHAVVGVAPLPAKGLLHLARHLVHQLLALFPAVGVGLLRRLGHPGLVLLQPLFHLLVHLVFLDGPGLHHAVQLFNRGFRLHRVPVQVGVVQPVILAGGAGGNVYDNSSWYCDLYLWAEELCGRYCTHWYEKLKI